MGVQVSVQITGDAASATAAIQLVSGKLGELANDQTKINSSGKQGASGVEALNGAIGALGGLIAAAGSASFIANLVEIGAAAERAGNSLDVMTGGKADEWMGKMVAATHGLIDDEDAATVATSMLTAGLAKNADQASNMIRVATILGASISGIPALQAAHDLEMMLNTANPRGLKEFGVNVEAVKDRIKELQLANKGLSDQQAFSMAFFEQASPLADKLSGVLDDQSAKIERLKISWANLGESVGMVLSDKLGPALDGANNLVGGINNVNTALDQQAGRMKTTQMSWGEFWNNLEASPGLADKLGIDMSKLFGQNVTDAHNLWQQIQRDVADNSKAMANSSSRAEELQAAQEKLNVSTATETESLDQLIAKVQGVNEALQISAAQHLIAQQDVGKLTGLWWGAGTSTKAAASDIADLNSALADQTAKLDDLNQWGGSDKQFAKTTEAINETTKALADANQQVSFGAGADMGKIFEFATGQLQNMGLSQTDLLAKYNDLGLATGQVTALQIAQGDALADLNTLYADGSISTESYLTGLSKIPAAQDAVTASSIAMQTAVAEATQKVKDAGGSAQEIINSAITAAQEAKGKTSTDDMVAGIQSTIDQINAMPGAQLKLLPDEAISAIETVTTAIDNLATHGASTPVTVATDNTPALSGIQEAIDKMMSFKDKTVTLTVNLQDNTGGGGPAAPEVPGHQHGTPYFEGGWSWVGEGGPELIKAPRGTQIKSNPDSRGMAEDAAGVAGSGGDTYMITGPLYITVPDKGGLSDIMQQISSVRK